MGIEETLEQRGNIYGSYEEGLTIRATMLEALKFHYMKVNAEPMPKEQQVWVMDLIIKLVRTSATPEHLDSIHDLIGYAKLIEEYLKEKITNES